MDCPRPDNSSLPNFRRRKVKAAINKTDRWRVERGGRRRNLPIQSPSNNNREEEEEGTVLHIIIREIHRLLGVLEKWRGSKEGFSFRGQRFLILLGREFPKEKCFYGKYWVACFSRVILKGKETWCQSLSFRGKLGRVERKFTYYYYIFLIQKLVTEPIFRYEDATTLFLFHYFPQCFADNGIGRIDLTSLPSLQTWNGTPSHTTGQKQTSYFRQRRN